MQKLPLFITALFLVLMSIKTPAQTPQNLAELWDKEHLSKIQPSNVRHKNLQSYLEQLKKLGLKVEEVGRSFAGREIYQVEFGRGPLKIFMWSQMHGDEPTATSALIDMFAALQNNRDKDWVKKIEETVTIRAVPMLNPDGAELFQRRNLQSIDINRDAKALQTPEGYLLKKLRDEWQPEIGFNLHNQNPLTTAGRTNRQAAISFLVVTGNPENKTDERHERNKRLVAAMVGALNNFIRGHIGRYSDAYNPRAFGDNFSAWGTPVILIETGAFHNQDELFLVKMNFIAFLTALKSLTDGSEKTFSPVNYDLLPNNSSGVLFSAIFRGGTLVDNPKTGTTFTADVAINAERRRAGEYGSTVIQEIGDLGGYYGLDEYDASQFYIVPRYSHLRLGERGEFLFYKKSRQIDWKSTNLEKDFPPDAVFSLGRWITGEGVVPKR